MDRLEFNDFEDFACDIADKYESIKTGYNDVAVVAKYEEARKIIRELLCIGYDLHSIEMYDTEWDGYDSEYITSIYDNEIWCEPMLRDNGYITDDSQIMYILDNCSSKAIPYCKGKKLFEVSIGECDCEDSDANGYAINGKSVSKEEFDEYVAKFKKLDGKTDKNNDLSTTSSTSSYSINGRKCTKEEYDKAVSEIMDKLNKMRDTLLDYTNFVDASDEYLKMLHWQKYII